MRLDTPSREEMNIEKVILSLTIVASLTAASHSKTVESDAQLRAAIESRTWYSCCHGYRFLPSGFIAVDGHSSGNERWSIHHELLYREVTGFPSSPTRIIEINDRQLVEQEVSGKYKGSVETMSSVRP
jgi:hypothetical protein